jgi:hypothetical protein
VIDFLLISTKFFGYSQEIKASLESRGRSVLWFDDRPGADTATKILVRLAPAIIKRKTEAYFDGVIAQACEHDIRDVLVIKGEALQPAMIQKMRKALPRARFTLFFWDSYRNMPANSSQKVPFFHKAFSFDPVDVRQDSRLSYRPLFFLNEYATLPTTGYDIDLLFIGTSHSDRYAVATRLARALPPELKFERVLFLSSLKLYYARKVADPSYWNAKRDEFVFKPLSKSEVLSLISRARVVVDIERPVQTGYTMRSIEMLGASRKLISTNPQTVHADFFRESNQLYIDRYKPKVPESFLNASWEPVASDILNRYSLDGWIDEVLG